MIRDIELLKDNKVKIIIDKNDIIEIIEVRGAGHYIVFQGEMIEVISAKLEKFMQDLAESYLRETKQKTDFLPIDTGD